MNRRVLATVLVLAILWAACRPTFWGSGLVGVSLGRPSCGAVCSVGRGAEVCLYFGETVAEW